MDPGAACRHWGHLEASLAEASLAGQGRGVLVVAGQGFLGLEGGILAEEGNLVEEDHPTDFALEVVPADVVVSSVLVGGMAGLGEADILVVDNLAVEVLPAVGIPEGPVQGVLGPEDPAAVLVVAGNLWVDSHLGEGSQAVEDIPEVIHRLVAVVVCHPRSKGLASHRCCLPQIQNRESSWRFQASLHKNEQIMLNR